MAILKGQDKMIAGRVRLLFGSVFYGTIITNLMLKESEHLPTMATDGKWLWYNKEFVDKLSKAEIEGVLAHEVLHIVLLTHLRQGNRDHRLWNISTDHAINLVLKAEGFRLPAGSLCDDKYKDWSAEKIYDHLINNPDERPQEGEGEPEWNIGGVEPAGSGGEEGEPGSGQPLTTEQVEMESHKVRSQVKAAAAQAKKAGQLSGNLESLIDEICAPRANWKDILQRFVREQAFTDWNFGKCHTRMLHSYGVINPVIDGEAIGRLAIIIDTSGSVSDEELKQFGGEISDILENYECNITVIYCDTEIKRVDEFTQDDLPLQFHAVGRGGTRMLPAHQYVEQELENVSAVIAFTDSYYFDWRDIPEPDCPALMACTSKRIASDVPDWMEVIDVSGD